MAFRLQFEKKYTTEIYLSGSSYMYRYLSGAEKKGNIDIFKMTDESDHIWIDCLTFYLKWQKLDLIKR